MDIKSIGGVVALSAVATAYTWGMGQAALDDSAAQISETSLQILDQWRTITTEFGIDTSNTGAGQLAPVVNSQRSALDLVIYSDHIVDEPFRPLFKTAGIPNMFDTVYMRAEGSEMRYFAGGIRIGALQDIDGEGLGVVMVNMPATIQEKLEERLQGRTLLEIGDTEHGHLTAIIAPYTLVF